MDLLFKRYASPFDYLDTLLDCNNIVDGVINIWETADDDKAWEMYLSNNPYNEKSFEDWKKELQQKTPKAMSEAEIGATIEKSQNILKNFKPQQQQVKT